ncbi:MAG TPA: GTPase [Rhodanobacteraceae bacterium]|nr:GTPase [Rhodanobacteraceae bacterium]
MHATTYNVVLAGPVGAVKTTALRTLADSVPVSTEMPLSGGPMGEKTTTTVALDYATVMLDDGTPVHLYGLPGQEHFSHMREIVMLGALGVIVLLAANQADVASQCRHWLAVIRAIDATVPLVIGITHTDLVPGFRMDLIRDAVAGQPSPVPVLTLDVRDREQAAQLIRTLLVFAA